jgi:hypothetical protein
MSQTQKPRRSATLGDDPKRGAFIVRCSLSLAPFGIDCGHPPYARQTGVSPYRGGTFMLVIPRASAAAEMPRVTRANRSTTYRSTHLLSPALPTTKYTLHLRKQSRSSTVRGSGGPLLVDHARPFEAAQCASRRNHSVPGTGGTGGTGGTASVTGHPSQPLPCDKSARRLPGSPRTAPPPPLASPAHGMQPLRHMIPPAPCAAQAEAAGQQVRIGASATCLRTLARSPLARVRTAPFLARPCNHERSPANSRLVHVRRWTVGPAVRGCAVPPWCNDAVAYRFV